MFRVFNPNLFKTYNPWPWSFLFPGKAFLRFFLNSLTLPVSSKCSYCFFCCSCRLVHSLTKKKNKTNTNKKTKQNKKKLNFVGGQKSKWTHSHISPCSQDHKLPVGTQRGPSSLPSPKKRMCPLYNWWSTSPWLVSTQASQRLLC